MFFPIIILLACAVAIYFSCDYFVNGIEWLGCRMKIGQTATGTILAAFGTALPESAVTFVAVVFGHSEEQKQIGVGAAIGGPLVLSTISYAVVGLMLWLAARKLQRANTVLHADQRHLSRDQAWFAGIFLCAAGLGVLVFPGKRWLGLACFTAYGLYVRKEIRQADDAYDKDVEPLKLQPRAALPGRGMIALQLAGSLAGMAVASHYFVAQMDVLAPLLGLPTQLVALLLSPVATELPETMNAIIWVRQGKEKLALANISGSMMIQATVPSGLGLLFTPWRFDAPLMIASGITLMAIGILYTLFRRGRVSGVTLMPMAGMYALFAAILLMY